MFGKFPFSMGALKLFPLLGIDVKIAMAYDGNDLQSPYNNVCEYYSSTWFKLGLGVDIPLGYRLYLRPTFLYGLAPLPKRYQERYPDSMKVLNTGTKKVDAIILHGLDLNVAVGFMYR